MKEELQNIFDFIGLNLTDKDFHKIKDMSEATFVNSYHHSLGQFLRNKLGLWDQNSENHKFFTGLGLSHPDDMSGLILHCYHRYINNLPLEVEEEVQYCKDYWKRMNEINGSSFTFKLDDKGRVVLNV